VDPGFRCLFRPDMPSSPTPGSSHIHKFQCRDVDIGLHRVLTGSALPRLPQIRFARAVDFVASVVRTLLRPASLFAPLNGSDRIAPAIGDFYFWASSRSVALPASRYGYNSDWTPLLTGLAPAGMAASLAAPTLTTERPATALLGPVFHRLDRASHTGAFGTADPTDRAYFPAR
jgi:hypothetical protein